MLTQIQPAAGRPPESLADALQRGESGDAVDLLLGCHSRIRHFTAVAVRLGQQAAPPEAVAAASAAVLRYYQQALPLHEADENLSVYPRLRAAAPPQQLSEANQAMVDQHVAIDAIVARLLPQWRAMCDHPELASRSLGDAAALQAAWTEHLALEERVVFPALRTYLSPDDLAAIRSEMHARRQMAS